MNTSITIYIISLIGSLLCGLYMKHDIYHQISIKDIIVALCPIINSVATLCLIMCLGCDIFKFIYKQFNKIK
ncbi:hypothetical protein EJM73_08485 [Clostridium botulinum]|uniref:Aminopeptidase (Precursor) n=1 Tax=Clostridium botulinum B str. Osaka05 TaxID=1407017 RepID=A0A060N328_CLOBO|nr:hypothetical protein [Clostridium botulinum]NCI19936.1 hypothetical protein [Clostridium botulinum]NCI35698.1 hypothetical protein [Clostridium botulinum]NCI71555.1 hypothetical protein [Clostridium botulinum]NDI38747.1 hypothetical protein [Clostridium botulinum]BAO04811.1 aminopeptidase (Precursor) [Clostridium botulinum B str. Osaka05]